MPFCCHHTHLSPKYHPCVIVSLVLRHLRLWDASAPGAALQAWKWGSAGRRGREGGLGANKPSRQRFRHREYGRAWWLMATAHEMMLITVLFLSNKDKSSSVGASLVIIQVIAAHLFQRKPERCCYRIRNNNGI